jgi:hypothetical protein
MRKGALLLAVLLAASFTTTADAAKKKRAAKPAPVAAANNQNGANFVSDGLKQWLVPAQSITRPVAAPAKVAKRSKKASKKKMRA